MKKFTLLFFFVMFGFLNAVPVFAAAPSFNHNLYYGITNSSEVRALQEFLISWGDYNGPMNGNFFSLTQQAVKKFQQINSISPVSGYFGPLTRAKVNIMVIPGSDAAKTLESGKI